MIGTDYNFILQISTYIHEVIAVTGDPYNQVAILSRILLGFP